MQSRGREPWSSGYGRRLTFEGCGFKACCVLDGHFFTLICCKIVLILFEKTDNKRKRGRGLPILKKECHLVGSGCDSVGRAVASDSRGPQFESSTKIYIERLLSTLLKRQKYRKRGRHWPLLKKSDNWKSISK